MATTAFETNLYLILYSAKLKSTMKPAEAVGLLDPPRGEAEIRARWADVERLKNDGLATTDLERRHYNDRLEEVKAVLLDGGAGARKKQIEAARQEIETRFLKNLSEYVFGGGKELQRSIFDRVANAYKRWLTPAGAEKTAKAAGYRIVDGAPGPKETPLPVPKKPADWPDKLAREAGVIDKKVPEYLSFLAAHEKRAIRDVYEFLKAGPTSPLTTLQKGLQDAKGRYPTQNASMVNKTPHLQAAASLFRVLDDVLKSETSRRHWERCWALNRIDNELRPVFSTRLLQGTPPKVRVDDYLGAVQKCREAGLSKEDAEYYAYEYYVVEKKCPMPARVEADKAPEEARFCGACHAANAKGAKNCTHCGAPLEVVCPKCGKRADYGDGNCPNCGFAVGDMPLAAGLVKEGREKLARKDFAGARAAAAQALAYWPGYQDALELLLEIAKQEAIIILESLSIAGTVTVDDKTRPGCIGLQWPAASAARAGMTGPEVAYRVVRREGAAPSSPEDGTKLTDTANTRYEDTSAEPGGIYVYGVFPCINGVPKRKGIVSRKAMTVGDVAEVKAMADEGCVRVSWKNPARALGAVCVRKKGGIPASLSDGETLSKAPGAEGVIDKGLQDGVTVGYRICAVFRGPDGKNETGPGVTCQATPARRPPTVEDCRCELTERGLKATWKPFAGAQMGVYRSTKPFASNGLFVRSGDGVFAAAEKLASVSSQAGVASVVRKFGADVFYVTLVSEKGGMSLVGPHLPVLPCVSGAKAFRRAGNLEVSWTWPSGADEVALLWRTDRTPVSPEDPAATRVVVKKTEYDRNGCHLIRSCGNGTYHFSAYTIVRDGKETLHSSGVAFDSIGAEEKWRIRYTLEKRRKWGVFGAVTGVVLHVRGDGLRCWPSMTLMKQRGRQPLHRGDGTPLTSIKGGRWTSVDVLLKVKETDAGCHLKLFLDDKALEEIVVLEHPGFSESRI